MSCSMCGGIQRNAGVMDRPYALFGFACALQLYIIISVPCLARTVNMCVVQHVPRNSKCRSIEFILCNMKTADLGKVPARRKETADCRCFFFTVRNALLCARALPHECDTVMSVFTI